MTVALVDMAIASNDIIINEVLAEKLNKTADGKLFLDRWNKFVLIYGGARVYAELSGLSTELKSLAKKVNKPEADQIAEEISKKVESVNLGNRFIARNGLELRDFLKTITVKPIGKSYKGNIYRSLSIESQNKFGASPKILTDHEVYSSWGRYDAEGAENAMYFSKTLSGNQTELTYYGNWNDFDTYLFTDVEIDNLLDLTDDFVRKQLGTQFDDLVRTIDDPLNPIKSKAFNYEMTNELATWARANGYNGLIVPGARGAQNYENVIIFNQEYINNILNDKLPQKVIK